jgi:hypothetical protein
VLDIKQQSLWTWTWTWIRQLRLDVDLAGPARGKPRHVARYWQQHHKKGKQKQHIQKQIQKMETGAVYRFCAMLLLLWQQVKTKPRVPAAGSGGHGGQQQLL